MRQSRISRAAAGALAFMLAAPLGVGASLAQEQFELDLGGLSPDAGGNVLNQLLPPQGGTAPLPDEDFFPASTGPSGDVKLPGIKGFAPLGGSKPLATAALGEVTLAARLTAEGDEIDRGLVWRVFAQQPGADGKLPLIASARGGTKAFELQPGSYLVHASFGRAGATKRITVGRDSHLETLVLDAGGLKLDAVISGGAPIPPDKLRFSIYESEEINGERALIIPDVSPDTVVRLKSGIYHIVSTYGVVNAVIRSDIRVEPGKLTEATVEHRAAELMLKLVREAGGEAMADTSWSVLTDAGDVVRESVGAYSSMVLAEGDYIVIAKNRERIYHHDLTVSAGENAEIEVLAVEAAEPADHEFMD